MAGRRGRPHPHPSAPRLPMCPSRPTGERGPGAEVPATAPLRRLRARFSSATRGTPESLSPDQRDSAAVPVTLEKGGAPPPRSRRGSSAPCSRGSPRKFRGAHAGRSWLLGPGTGSLQLPRPQDTHQAPEERDC